MNLFCGSPVSEQGCNYQSINSHHNTSHGPSPIHGPSSPSSSTTTSVHQHKIHNSYNCTPAGRHGWAEPTCLWWQAGCPEALSRHLPPSTVRVPAPAGLLAGVRAKAREGACPQEELVLGLTRPRREWVLPEKRCITTPGFQNLGPRT